MVRVRVRIPTDITRAMTESNPSTDIGWDDFNAPSNHRPCGCSARSCCWQQASSAQYSTNRDAHEAERCNAELFERHSLPRC